jgi:hypothetical protein
MIHRAGNGGLRLQRQPALRRWKDSAGREQGLEGIVGLAPQPRRRRPPRAWPAEVEQVRAGRGVGRLS